ncbi:MAG: tyrosine-type recombinase/integrase [Rhodobacteraceae bacterium]|nr:tyrosine-type recombinase/integrase [Paracoccaceae bacterium]
MPRIRRAGCWLEKISNSENWYICWYDPATQRTRRRSTQTESKEHAEAALAQHVLENSRPRDADPEYVQIAALLDHWLSERGSKIPSAEANSYGVIVLLEHFGTERVSALTPLRQDKFVDWMRDRDYADSTTNRHLTILRAALRHAWKNGRLKGQPYIKSIKENEPKPKHIFTPDQFAEFLDRAKQIEHIFRFCMISANTLARPDAVRALTPFQVKFDERRIELNPPGRRQTKKYRPIVPITDTLLPWLRSWDGSPYVNYNGAAVFDIGKSFARIGADMGLTVTPYCIRHTMATQLNREGVSESQIARFLGHKPRDTTKATEFYIHHRPEYLAEAVAAIDAYFGKLPLKIVRPAAHLRVVEV